MERPPPEVVVRQAGPGGPPFPGLTVPVTGGIAGRRAQVRPSHPFTLPDPLSLSGSQSLFSHVTSGLSGSLLQVLTQCDPEGSSPLHKMTSWSSTPKDQASADWSLQKDLRGPRRGRGRERLERNPQLMLFITSVNPAKPTGNNVYLFAV